jgi:hypothetical protein
MPNKVSAPAALREDAERVADVAGVPSEEREHFCDLLCWTVQTVHRRARRAEPGPALTKAANAARALDEALARLNKEDQGGIEELLAEHPGYSDVKAADAVLLLRETVWWLVALLSTAIGKSPGSGTQPAKQGRRRGTVENAVFQDFVFDLMTNAGASGGEFTFDKNYEKGTLLDAIKILTSHLPEGVVPKNLSRSMGTIQRIVTKYRKILPNIDNKYDSLPRDKIADFLARWNTK